MTTTIYHNATIFTSEPDGRNAEAFAVTDGLFSAVGTLENVRAKVGGQPRGRPRGTVHLPRFH